MRSSLWWTLGAVAALSVVAVLAFPPSNPIVLPTHPDAPPGAATSSAAAVATEEPLPPVLLADRPMLALAERDPFAITQPTTAAAPPPAPTTEPAPAPEPSPPPPAEATPVPTALPAPAPPRYFGAMRSPDGAKLVYLLEGAEPILAEPGIRFESGYVVADVQPHVVRLVHPETGASLMLDLPNPIEP